MEALKIIGFSILAAVLYGTIHDLITAHLSIEYFTIGHPKIINDESPIVLALLWGVIATWWVGLILGVLLAIAARLGQNPKLNFKEIVRPIAILLGIMAISAILGGLIGFILAKFEVIYLVDTLAEQIKPKRHHLFLTAGWAHSASYIIGIIGVIVVSYRLWRKRRAMTSKL